MKNTDYKCPKCGCETATKIPIELLDGVKNIWYSLIILFLVAGTVSPMFLLICFVCIILHIVLNIIKKIVYRNEWLMQCTRCGAEYGVPNPDRVEAVQKAAESKKLKAEEKAEYYKKKEQYKKNALELNGALQTDETLIDEIKDIGFHKNAFVTKYGNIKITDNALIYYNEIGSLRIPKNECINIKKRNYFFFIPTGIQIKTTRRKINLVMEPKLREDYILRLKG